jgi:hypothetical protein
MEINNMPYFIEDNEINSLPFYVTRRIDILNVLRPLLNLQIRIMREDGAIEDSYPIDPAG